MPGLPSLRTIMKDLDLKVGALAFGIMVITVSANVVIRAVTGESLVFTEELAYVSFAYSIFMPLSYLYRSKGMIAVDILVARLNPKVRLRLQSVTYVFLTLINGYLAYLSYVLATNSWLRKTPFLEISYFYINLAPTIGFSVMAFYSLMFVFNKKLDGDVL